jgi:hypothetical protein
MTKSWPDSNVTYDYPDNTKENEAAWQAGIADALDSGSLKLIPRGKGGDLFDLIGSCPRCGHSINQSIEFNVIVGVLPVGQSTGLFNIDCDCPVAHDTSDAKRKGCGWGGPIDVPLTAP